MDPVSSEQPKVLFPHHRFCLVICMISPLLQKGWPIPVIPAFRGLSSVGLSPFWATQGGKSQKIEKQPGGGGARL